MLPKGGTRAALFPGLNAEVSALRNRMNHSLLTYIAKATGWAGILSLWLVGCGPRPALPPAAAIYRDNCQVCHGPGGRGGVRDPVKHRLIPGLKVSLWSRPGGGKVLAAFITDGSWVAGAAATGAVNMPAFGGILSAHQLTELENYIEAGFPSAPPVPVSTNGLTVYRESGCQTCHGPLGGPGGAVGGFAAGQPLAFYLKPLRQGSVPVDAAHPLGRIGEPIMPAIGWVLPSTSFWALISYLENGQPTPLCRPQSK